MIRTRQDPDSRPTDLKNLRNKIETETAKYIESITLESDYNLLLAMYVHYRFMSNNNTSIFQAVGEVPYIGGMFCGVIKDAQ